MLISDEIRWARTVRGASALLIHQSGLVRPALCSTTTEPHRWGMISFTCGQYCGGRFATGIA